MVALKYGKRSVINQLMLAVKRKSRMDTNEWLILKIKPLVKPCRWDEVVTVVQDYRKGLMDLNDAGTAFANCLGYNVIHEDTLNEKV